MQRLTFPFYKMDIYAKDVLLASLMIDGTDFSSFWVESFDQTNFLQPFRSGVVETKQVQDFLQTRIFPFERTNRKELLELLDLPGYDIYRLAMETHGILLSDYLWLRFDDEPYTWEELYENIYACE